MQKTQTRTLLLSLKDLFISSVKLFMAVILQPWLVLSLFFVFHGVVTFCSCQPTGPRNIETFYPTAPADPPAHQPPTPVLQPQLPSPPPVAASGSSSNTRSQVAKAVAATAAGTLVLSGIAFLLVRRCLVAKRKEDETGSGFPRERRVVNQLNEFERFDGNLKGFIVDENGLDVIYWRNLEERKSRGFKKEVRTSYRKNQSKRDEKEENGEEKDGSRTGKGSQRRRRGVVVQEIPLLRGKSSSSHLFVSEEDDRVETITTMNHLPRRSGSSAIYVKYIEKPDSSSASSPPPPPSPPPTPPSQSQQAIGSSAVPEHKIPCPPPPPPISDMKSPEIPTPFPDNNASAPPTPPPPPPPNRGPAPPPPPTNGGTLNSTAKPPAARKEMRDDSKNGKPSGEGMAGNGNGQVKLKPLHWDKVNANTDHSMVWDKIGGGSFRFDGDLMEALFGYVAANKRSQAKCNASSSNSNAVQSAKTFILDPRKSQNTAIVLKSLTASSEEIIHSLKEGEGLSADTIEKLAKIAPTEEEQSLILDYKGDLSKLADAEAFLHQICKAVPTAFKRLDAMLFRLNFDLEILQLKESLQILELGCKELRTRGLFMKLLEAILKAGNRMNAGTPRGNAQAFNLTALRKLSDVKSMDGKTTLLHFVVEEVVRSEGKRCAINRDHSLNRNNSLSSKSYLNVDRNLTSEEEKDREYVRLGLAIVGGLSAEFSNVKKSAAIDYDSFSGTVLAFGSRMSQIRHLVIECDDGGGERFIREMKSFLEYADRKLEMVKEDQAGVIELVRRTTEYYQSGSSRNREANQLQLFGIVKDFLGMVDQTCIEIARNMQKRKTSVASSSPQGPAGRGPVKFPNLRGRFMLDNSECSSSDSNGDA